MNYSHVINELSRNKEVFKRFLSSIEEETFLWRPEAQKWCLLEIICHLRDEEVEDFRTRLKYVLETPGRAFPTFNPTQWVEERKYVEQNFETVLTAFLIEREKSITWLESLSIPDWDNFYDHPKLGPMSAKMILSNWLAHDYLHIRQILKLKFEYLKFISGENLSYAGNW